MQELKLNSKKKYDDWKKSYVKQEALICNRMDKALIIMHAKAINDRKKGIIPKIYNEEDKIK